ncbi:ABC-type transport auxiliary lipoprotein family protein [Rhizobium metallidurans]|uniref:Cholesterol transport system auxiliary component n=1 Tax=Rhizobium metallidurans TaxID=1265931 RepID=A0A7W6CSY3_9HYPH|nr:ABC-type transport auxiliary lipoprotein family protein [Rhizobium metallidurans]MBB3966587.1 cholesterol transport system auxiliary component [Rhizobium metallidurans]
MAVSDIVVSRSWLMKSMIAMPLLAATLAGCGTAAKNDTYDLSAPTSGAGPSAKGRQILVQQPTALQALNSEQIVIKVSSSEIQYLAKAQWSDKLPRMVQAKLVEAYENSGKVGGVGVPGQGLAIDYQVITDIRAFEIRTGGGSQAVVEISAKIVNDRNGSVRGQKVFSQTVPTGGGSNEAFVKALDRAFASVTTEIVDWTLTSI